ncbi:MAG: cobalamin-dependent protein [Candidatus Bathyarchaeia archaeon]|jgi:methanogenic corrinoid protein MtbC1
MDRTVLEEIANSIVGSDIERVKKLVEEAVTKGVPPIDVINAMSTAMAEVGRKYSEGDYFLTDLLVAGEMMKAAMAIVKPYVKDEPNIVSGKVVIGSAEGDIHDIGKDLVATFLSSGGFAVTDLGADVPAKDFVEKVASIRAYIVAISALLTTTAAGTRAVLESLERAGVRKDVKAIIGGAATTPALAAAVGADAFGKDALDGLGICKDWMAKRPRAI